MVSQFGETFIVGVILYGVIAPVAEELVFRGLLSRSLYTAFRKNVVRQERTTEDDCGEMTEPFTPKLAAAIASAALFGLYHGNSVQFLYAFMLGIVLGCFYLQSGDIKTSILLHATANLVIFGLSFTKLGVEFISWPVCLGMAILSGICFLLIQKCFKTDYMNRK
ncbi:MAG: CPBP family intramembrane metalloprotease [Lachnospiraceae bacterium]|nr:CPBP family intramembrane metalloprotease [Lachnospiraceae bacterium]